VSFALSPQIAAAPPADADGCWHYTYITYHPDTGEWYAGKHTTRNLDDGYLGSGNWVKGHPARSELIIEVVEFFYSEEHAFAAEAILVDFGIIDADPLCRNEAEGGVGISKATFSVPLFQRKYQQGIARREANPEWKQRLRERWARLKTTPEFQQKNREAIARRTADPEWLRRTREGLAKRGANQEWLQKQGEAAAKRAANPEWLPKMREGIARREANPEYRRKHREAMRRVAADSVYLQKAREVGARNAANPEWRRNVAEANARLAADPEWLRKNREGVARREANRRAKKALATKETSAC
jgi:hypothetical protein